MTKQVLDAAGMTLYTTIKVIKCHAIRYLMKVRTVPTLSFTLIKRRHTINTPQNELVQPYLALRLLQACTQITKSFSGDAKMSYQRITSKQSEYVQEIQQSHTAEKPTAPAICLTVTCLIIIYYHAVHCVDLTVRGRSIWAS